MSLVNIVRPLDPLPNKPERQLRNWQMLTEQLRNNMPADLEVGVSSLATTQQTVNDLLTLLRRLGGGE